MLRPVDPFFSRGEVATTASAAIVHGLAPIPRSSGMMFTASSSRASAVFQLIWSEGGGPRCGQVETLYVAETPTEVIVELGDAPVEPPPGQACVASGQLVKGTITLSKPLGSRSIVTPQEG